LLRIAREIISKEKKKEILEGIGTALYLNCDGRYENLSSVKNP
jgi:hypothetical protein